MLPLGSISRYSVRPGFVRFTQTIHPCASFPSCALIQFENLKPCLLNASAACACSGVASYVSILRVGVVHSASFPACDGLRCRDDPQAALNTCCSFGCKLGARFSRPALVPSGQLHARLCARRPESAMTQTVSPVIAASLAPASAKLPPLPW